MTIHFTNQRDKEDSMDVSHQEYVVTFNKQGLKIHWGLYAKQRKNDAHPIVLGFFASEVDRDAELSDIRDAFAQGEKEYSIKRALPVDRDFSKILG